ncbi:glutamate receptor U1-like [Argiope bruennichi]|uniref:glutamate receptor U1-like n=1 Tax=Argiope bruennichi TaxID=94029 RepID=UPI0024950819|nr:glutamate receptor U1-like [Argiope bruennichi]
MHFRVAIGEWTPFLKIKTEHGRVIMSGSLAEAFDTLARRVNFTYTLYRSEGDIWGTHSPDGSWTGMLGMLSRNEVDIALGPFTLTYGRWTSFRMSEPLYADDIEILVPVFEWKMSLFNILTVFNYEVWMFIFLSIILLLIVMCLSDKCMHPESKIIDRFFKNLWSLIRTILLKGCVQRPDSYTRALLDTLWMLSTLVMSFYFSGMVLTYLFLRKTRQIDSLGDLAASKDIQPILEYQSSVYSTFRDSDSPVFSTLFKRVQQNPTQCILSFKNISRFGMDLVYSRSFAIITEGIALRNFLYERHKRGLPCNFRMAKTPVWGIRKVIAFNENLPQEWINRMDDVLRHNSESGWLQQRMIDEFSGYTECISEGNVGVQSLQFENTLGTFVILAMGCSVSIVALFAERLYSYSKKQTHSLKEEKNIQPGIQVLKIECIKEFK